MTAFTIASATRRATAKPRDAEFYQDPYAFYSALHLGTPTFLWEDYGHWCFTGFKDVNTLLRDKRFGREILHVMTREELGWAPPKQHTAVFDLTEKYSLLALEPPAHTRLRTLVNRAFVSRHVEQLRPRIERLANEIIDKLRTRGWHRADQELRRPDPGCDHRRDDRRCRPRWQRSCSTGPTGWSRCTCTASRATPSSTPIRRRRISWTICAR